MSLRNFRIEKFNLYNPIVDASAKKAIKRAEAVRVPRNAQAGTRLKRAFALLTGIFTKEFVRNSSRFLGETGSVFSKSRNDYYNSIDLQKLGNSSSRLIIELECRKRLIIGGKYYKKEGVHSGIALISNFLHFQGELNTKIHQIFLQNLPPNLAALASGTLIGAQVKFPATFKKQLVSTGLIHVVVASGYNLSLVSVYLVSFTKKIFPKKAALFASLIGIWWYVFLALGNPSIVRAGWMCSISVVATLVGRPYSQFRSLLISVLIMLVLSPLLIVNISFQLSVAATLGVMIFGAKQSKEENASVQKSQLKNIWETILENFKTTFGANLLTFPIIAFWFGRVSLISLFANVALLWIIPMVMFFSFLLFVVVVVCPWIKSVFVIPVFALCWSFIHGVELFSHFPYASVDIPHWSLFSVCIFYIFLFAALWVRTVVSSNKELHSTYISKRK